jgi:hypothetical protein
MTTIMEKKMIGAFYRLSEENPKLRSEIESLQAQSQAKDARITELEKFRLTVAHALQRPDFCSLEGLAMYAIQDIGWLQGEHVKQEAYIQKLEAGFLAYHEATFWKEEYQRTGRNISEEQSKQEAQAALEELRRKV